MKDTFRGEVQVVEDCDPKRPWVPEMWHKNVGVGLGKNRGLGQIRSAQPWGGASGNIWITWSLGLISKLR